MGFAIDLMFASLLMSILIAAWYAAVAMRRSGAPKTVSLFPAMFVTLFVAFVATIAADVRIKGMELEREREARRQERQVYWDDYERRHPQ